MSEGQRHYLVNGAERAGAQDLDSLQLRLFEDAQLSLVGCGPAGRQRLHQL